MSEYKVSSGARFSFCGWENGEDPVSCFNRRDWIGCLHGICLMLYRTGDKNQALNALADDGIVHELVHLMARIDICTHHTEVSLRRQIKNLQTKFLETIT